MTELTPLEKRYCVSFKIIPFQRELKRALTKEEVAGCIAEVVADRDNVFQMMELEIQQLFEGGNQDLKDDFVTAMTGTSMEDGAIDNG